MKSSKSSATKTKFDCMESGLTTPQKSFRMLWNLKCEQNICVFLIISKPLHSTVVRASARGAGGRGSIPDRVTPKT